MSSGSKTVIGQTQSYLRLGLAHYREELGYLTSELQAAHTPGVGDASCWKQILTFITWVYRLLQTSSVSSAVVVVTPVAHLTQQ